MIAPPKNVKPGVVRRWFRRVDELLCNYVDQKHMTKTSAEGYFLFKLKQNPVLSIESKQAAANEARILKQKDGTGFELIRG